MSNNLSSSTFFFRAEGHCLDYRCRASLSSPARCMSTTVAADKPAGGAAPPPAAPKRSADVKINSIVDEISGLTLLQAADLVAALKVGGVFCFMLPEECLTCPLYSRA